TGTRILRGRALAATDRAGTPDVVVVSDAMARALWPGRDAIGECVRLRADTTPCRTVVGIAENVKQESVGDDPGLEFYLPAAQDGEHRGRLLIRVRGDDAAAQVESLRRHLSTVLPSSAYLSIRPLSQLVGDVTRSWRLGATMFS